MALAEVGKFGACRRTRSARRCARSLFYEAQQLIKGLYALFLRDWLSSFDPSQLLLLRLEDYDAAPAAHLRAVLTFLSLTQPTGALWRRMLSRPRANVHRAGASGSTALLPETRSLLASFYAPFNEELAALLGDDRFLWKDCTGNVTATPGVT